MERAPAKHSPRIFSTCSTGLQVLTLEPVEKDAQVDECPSREYRQILPSFSSWGEAPSVSW